MISIIPERQEISYRPQKKRDGAWLIYDVIRMPSTMTKNIQDSTVVNFGYGEYIAYKNPELQEHTRRMSVSLKIHYIKSGIVSGNFQLYNPKYNKMITVYFNGLQNIQRRK